MQKALRTIDNNRKNVSVKELETKVNALENDLLHIRSLYTQLYNRQYISLYQRVKKFSHFFFYGTKAWLSLAPGSRPRRFLHRLSIHTVLCLQNSRLFAKIYPLLFKYAPNLALKIKQVFNSPNAVFKQMDNTYQKISKEIVAVNNRVLQEIPNSMHPETLKYMISTHHKLLEQLVTTYNTTLSSRLTEQELTPQGAVVYHLLYTTLKRGL